VVDMLVHGRLGAEICAGTSFRRASDADQKNSGAGVRGHRDR